MRVISLWRITYANITLRQSVLLNGQVHCHVIWRLFWRIEAKGGAE
jgi:hypothetical protein